MADNPQNTGATEVSPATQQAVAQMLVRLLTSAVQVLYNQVGDPKTVAAPLQPPPQPPQLNPALAPIQIEPPSEPAEPAWRDTPMSSQEIASWRAGLKRDQIQSDRESRRQWTANNAQKKKDELGAIDEGFKGEQKQQGETALRDMRRPTDNPFTPIIPKEKQDLEIERFVQITGATDPTPPKPTPSVPRVQPIGMTPNVMNDPASQPTPASTPGTPNAATQEMSQSQLDFFNETVQTMRSMSDQISSLAREVRDIRTKGESKRREGKTG